MSLWNALKPWRAKDADEGLVYAAQRGDRRAFDVLVHAYQRPLRGFLARRCGPAAADDVLQETWLAAWTALPRFAGRSRFKAWLFGIALHKAVDYQRARGTVLEETGSEILEDYVSNDKDPFAAVDLKHAVQAALADLPDAQRQVLELYYYAELTLPEIAEATGRNLNTVKYQFYRAHTQAADALQDCAPALGSGSP